MDHVTKSEKQALLEQARVHLREALALCDQAGQSVAACHLQHGLDLLENEELPHVVHQRLVGRAH
jgi:hypothetical protein